MSSAVRRSVFGLCCTAMLAACAAPGEVPLPDRRPAAYRPPEESAEAGLWMVMERVERRLKTSGRVIVDPRLNDFVRGVLCRVGPSYCDTIRIYIVETSGFNASMTPNGAMMLWSGTLLRVENEAQLAMVLAHELAHFIKAHSIKRWRDARAKTDFLGFFSIVTAGAGIGPVGQLATIATVSSIFAFSRDQERESDRLGFDMAVAAGFDPEEAPRIWKALIDERKAGGDEEPTMFFATHPAAEERVENLEKAAKAAYQAHPGKTFVKNRERLSKAVRPWLGRFFREELQARKFERMQLLLDRHLKTDAESGTLHFYQGELYRLRKKEHDIESAVKSYRRAVTTGTAPPETYRSLGLVLQTLGDKEGALQAFATYLRLVPDAGDKLMIEAYMKRLET